jgi:hypothetical protein
MSERKRKAVEEEEGWNEIGNVTTTTMCLEDDGGNVEYVTKTGVNEEPTFRAAKLARKVCSAKMKVLLNVDEAVHSGEGDTVDQNVSKKIKHINIVEGAKPSEGLPTSEYVSAPTPAPVEEKPSLLKNMIDNLQGQVNKIGDRIQSLNTHDKIIIGVACAALALGIAGFAIGLHLLH